MSQEDALREQLVKAREDEASVASMLAVVQRRLDTCERLRAERAREFEVHLQALRACIMYARDRRGGAFDSDKWEKMVEYALRAGDVPPHALEDAQAKEAQAWEAVKSIREARDLWKQRATVDWSKGPYGGVDDPGAARVEATGHVATIRELTEQLRLAKADSVWLRSAWEAEIKCNEELIKQRDALKLERDIDREERQKEHERWHPSKLALRSLVRAHCSTPLLIGHSVAVDYEQLREFDENPAGLRLRREIATVDELRGALDVRLKTLTAANEHVRERLRIAEAVRDDARDTSQRYLDEKRELQQQLRVDLRRCAACGELFRTTPSIVCNADLCVECHP